MTAESHQAMVLKGPLVNVDALCCDNICKCFASYQSASDLRPRFVEFYDEPSLPAPRRIPHTSGSAADTIYSI